MEPLFDLLALPIASQVVLLLMAACMPEPWARIYALAAYGVLVFHIIAAAARGPGLWRTMKALTTAPAYILWKLWIIPQIWRTSRANAAWVRTQRESPVGGQ
jgi:hypothetical protein